MHEEYDKASGTIKLGLNSGCASAPARGVHTSHSTLAPPRGQVRLSGGQIPLPARPRARPAHCRTQTARSRSTHDRPRSGTGILGERCTHRSEASLPISGAVSLH
eukprot:scaffold38713_cov73-Phaeocystis_antarctica.AAC.3